MWAHAQARALVLLPCAAGPGGGQGGVVGEIAISASKVRGADCRVQSPAQRLTWYSFSSAVRASSCLSGL
jgi:hypothetical protein